MRMHMSHHMLHHMLACQSSARVRRVASAAPQGGRTARGRGQREQGASEAGQERQQG
jgi:hypothetical protein